MIKQAHGYKYHWALAQVDADQAYAVGRAAVELALAGKNAVMPVIRRRSSKPYRWDISSVAISEVANREKKVPREFITADGFGITASCRRYLEPLIAGEAYPPYQRGIPRYATLKGARVRRLLTTDFKV